MMTPRERSRKISRYLDDLWRSADTLMQKKLDEDEGLDEEKELEGIREWELLGDLLGVIGALEFCLIERDEEGMVDISKILGFEYFGNLL